MAKQLLNRHQIDPTVEQMRCKRMTQAVRRRFGNDATSHRPLPDHALHRTRREPFTIGVDEERSTSATACVGDECSPCRQVRDDGTIGWVEPLKS